MALLLTFASSRNPSADLSLYERDWNAVMGHSKRAAPPLAALARSMRRQDFMSQRGEGESE